MAFQLEVAEVAAILNVLIIIVKLSYPLLVTVLAVGTLRGDVNAATWSVFGRLVNDSPWRNLLRTDTASSIKVDIRTRALAAFAFLLGILLAIAAAVTPLGLHQTMKLRQSDKIEFAYVKDTSAIGQATPAHSAYTLGRTCGSLMYEPCPGNSDGYTYIYNDSGIYGIANPGTPDTSNSIPTQVASNITELFTSASFGNQSTVASVFDIQYRSFIKHNNATDPGPDRQWLDNGQPQTIGQFRFSQDFINDDKIQAIEGLVVSMAKKPGPGIGFRNNTLPIDGSRKGYVWDEDLLWLEPVTECTNLNITYDFTMRSPGDFNGVPNARITDRGGFVNMVKDYPYLDLNDTQTDAKLLEKSWKAAVLTDRWLQLFLNETRHDTRMNKEYRFDDPQFDLGLDTSTSTDPRSIALSTFGSFDDDPEYYYPNLPGPLSGFNTWQNYSDGDSVSLDVLIGFGGADLINISTSGAIGGLMLGMATPSRSTDDPEIDNEAYDRLDPGTNWTQPLFACVSAVKASIKRVRFHLNGTAVLSNVIVESVSPVDYTPLWAMEMPYLNISRIAPFWGVVSDDVKDAPGLATVRKAEFFLPAGRASYSNAFWAGADSAAGTSAPWEVFGMMFQSSTADEAADFVGNTNWPLAQKWAALTADASTAGQVINYIWTNLMANHVVSAKSVLSRTNGTDAESVMMPARYYERSVGYDWRYAIPALCFVVLYMVSLAASLILIFVRKMTIGTIRQVLNQSSAGRAMTTERFRGSDEDPGVDNAATKRWAQVRGDEPVRLEIEMKSSETKNGYGMVSLRPVEETSSSEEEEGAQDNQDLIARPRVGERDKAVQQQVVSPVDESPVAGTLAHEQRSSPGTAL